MKNAVLKNNLKKLRENLNISRELLADKTKLDVKEIEKIEEKFANPSITTAMKIARFFNKHVEDIFNAE